MDWAQLASQVPGLAVLALLTFKFLEHLHSINKAEKEYVHTRDERFLEALRARDDQFTTTLASISLECHRVQAEASAAIRESTRTLAIVHEHLEHMENRNGRTPS